MFDFLSPILSSQGGILSAWSIFWWGLRPWGDFVPGDYVRGGGAFCPTPFEIHVRLIS